MTMKIVKQALAALTVIMIMTLIGCATKPNAAEERPLMTRRLLDDKGSGLNIPTPAWVGIYLRDGISGVQREYRDVYCVIGEQSGVNRQFVLSWADGFSARQRIAQMVRTTISTELSARTRGMAESQGGAMGSASGSYSQQINDALGVIDNVSYSGAQRESDWWRLERLYDPDDSKLTSDEYTAFVLYTIPKAMMNQQIARALETSISRDSDLYQITIDLARNILLNGFDYLGDGGRVNPDASSQASAASSPASTTDPTGNISIRNNSNRTGSTMTAVRIYSGFETRGTPYLVYSEPVLGGREVNWNLPEGPYTVEVFLNNGTEGRSTNVGVTAGTNYTADFYDGNISQFTRK